MKRWISLLLVIVVLLTLAGCAQTTPAPERPVNFYYPANETIYDGKTPVIQAETREGSGYEEDIAGLLTVYLRGPVSEELRSPFPRWVKVTHFAASANIATLELSSEFSLLSGIDLTIACACIANTLFDLTDVHRVQIYAADSQLDSQTAIVLDRDDIYFADTQDVIDSVSENDATSAQQ